MSDGIIGAIIGGVLGLIGVAISLYFNFKSGSQSQQFQERLNQQNNEFQKELNLTTIKFEKQLEKERKDFTIWTSKYNIFIQLIGYRYNLGTKEFMFALNSISGAFYDKSLVNERLLELFKVIIEDLNIQGNIDEFFLKQFYYLFQC